MAGDYWILKNWKLDVPYDYSTSLLNKDRYISYEEYDSFKKWKEENQLVLDKNYRKMKYQYWKEQYENAKENLNMYRDEFENE